jgi:hypothetical protein
VQYYELEEFRHLYLEDSYVLGLDEGDRSLSLRMEFVLRESHPTYRPPPADRQYCYRKGTITFANVRQKNWIEKTFALSRDASGEVDYGNIDTFTYEGDWSKLQGDWGEVHIQSDCPTVELTG